MRQDDFALRLARLEARENIRELVARYGIAIDDHDLPGIASLFTSTAEFCSRDGVMQARGRDQIIDMFIGRFKALGISNHFTHDHIIELPAGAPDRATGLVTSHAEVWRNGKALLGAMRYQDSYRLDEGEWRFERRELAFLYYLPVEDYAEGLGSTLRQRAYGDQRPADYPEALPGWQDYRSTDDAK